MGFFQPLFDGEGLLKAAQERNETVPYEPTPITAPPTYETLKALWLGKAPTAGASERYDREVNFEAWALEHGIRPMSARGARHDHA